ncbi:uncharacterized protein Z518_10226 [Rhinocladiella mackenziei CBS 650.93]|uniref:AAA-ATPase-like domain-containing protein n=1 Tax=Rhinocladiella mackenziei CBS 650.93 TaxID=1442369 RepID=A0A0D2I2V7_9EURO|nr:uncharacterized protein Z518_10226 [Rhinocladiella mackenziei CBS 650.93]KIX00089.1 hypothetical protein Z518_10226 [Rhinocladiella mackenziei CBS 650.93]
MESWDDEQLLEWIQKIQPNIFRNKKNVSTFKAAEIDGSTFLDYAGDIDFFSKTQLPPGVYGALASLAKKVKKQRDSEQIGPPRKKRRLEVNQPPNPKRFQLSLLSGSSAIYEAEAEAGTEAGDEAEAESTVSRSHVLFPASAEFTNFSNNPGAIVVDKTHFIPLLEESAFQYMFLRPRRWGKSTFLNMLAAYYDVNTKDSFEEIFGGLYIGKAPTKARNSHLVLLFDFSTITANGSFEAVSQSVFDCIYGSIRDFLLKYRNIFGDVSPDEYIVPGRAGPSLQRILNLIYERGYTAFVGVDEYDAPVNTCLMSALRNRTRLPERAQVIDYLEDILKSQFFAVMKKASDRIVAKYWLTGVLPAFRDGISPLTATQVLSFDSRYRSMCGLTHEDVETIVTRALRDLPEIEPARILDSLRQWCNGYRFSAAFSHSKDSTLYNPQLVFVYLRNIMSGQPPLFYNEEPNTVRISTVLSTVGETGPVTIRNLLEMLFRSNVQGKISTELSFAELTQDPIIRPSDVTWSLLYCLGVVTFHEHLGYLRAPNRSMVELITERIRAYLNGDPDFSTRMRRSYDDFMNGNTTTFVNLLEEFFGQGHIRSFANTYESNLEMATRFLWVHRKQCVDQMHLVVDPTKTWGTGRNGFVDLFVGNAHRQYPALNSVIVMELKNVSLYSLWKGKQKSPSVEPNSQSNYEPLAKELRQATEDQMLNLKYSYQDKTGKWVTQQVNDIMKAAIAQVNNYVSIISCGPGGRGRAGVDDSRVSCGDGGRDVLCGYVIICVGGTRAICRHTVKKNTQWSYEVTSV